MSSCSNSDGGVPVRDDSEFCWKIKRDEENDVPKRESLLNRSRRIMGDGVNILSGVSKDSGQF